jgi:peptidyl-prolyl cis-trans isomerase C
MALAGLVPLLLAASSADADPKSDETIVVVRVGNSTLTGAEIAQKFSQVPDFQRESFGKTAQDRTLGFVNQVVVPELLLSEEGKSRKLTEKPELEWQVRRLLAQALEEQIRAKEDKAISDQDVRDYFDKHQQELGRPRALRLFRLLTRDRATAEKLLRQAKGITDMADWRKLVREHSIDKATKLRGGDLGFVHADGNTRVPRVRVSKQLFEAADQVQDGQLVDRVLPDEGHFAVVWRRGTLNAFEPGFDAEAPRIRLLLIEQAVQRELEALVEKLAEGKVTRENSTLLEELEVATPADPQLPGSAFLLPTAPTKPARPAASQATSR